MVVVYTIEEISSLVVGIFDNLVGSLLCLYLRCKVFSCAVCFGLYTTRKESYFSSKSCNIFQRAPIKLLSSEKIPSISNFTNSCYYCFILLFFKSPSLKCGFRKVSFGLRDVIVYLTNK